MRPSPAERLSIRWPAVLLWCVLGATPVLGADPLDVLLSDYQAHGLPLPPRDATLAHLPDPEVSISDGVRRQDLHLVLVVKPATLKAPAVYWLGCRPGPRWHGIELRRVPPRRASLDGTVPLPRDFRERGFPTYADLALAVQCRAQGWNDIAAALLERSRQRPSENPFRRPLKRPADDRVALAELAWNHYCNEFTASHGDRRPIVAHMKKLLASPFGLDSQAHRNLVADMEKTLVATGAEAGSLDAAIDALRDLAVDGIWPGCGSDDVYHNYADWNPHYCRLRDAGFRAVPVLLRHLDDYRLTRCTETVRDSRYTWHVRIADVVALLLNGLAPEPFAYDFRRAEGRGVSLDRDNVNHWWRQALPTPERDYLLAHVTWQGRGDRPEPNGHVLHVLGARYPDALVKLFEQQLQKGEGSHELFRALADSRASDKTKRRLFLAAAESKDEWTRILAQRELVSLDRAAAVPVLLKALAEIPKTPAEPYWTANAGDIAQTAFASDDPRVWEALAKTARRVDVGQRLEILNAFSRIDFARQRLRAARFLRGFLTDTEVRDRKSSKLFEGPCAGFLYDRIAVRDFAAERLANLLDLSVTPDPTWQAADWQKLRERVQAAVADFERKQQAGKEGKK
jgi:hypothetical protein